MFAHTSDSKLGRKRMITTMTLLAMILSLPFGAAAQKKKKVADTTQNQQKRVNFDLSKIVWPNPPAIARVKFVEQFTGQKIDFDTKASKQQKAKQGWMDRLAGTKPQVDQQMDLPFQLSGPMDWRLIRKAGFTRRIRRWERFSFSVRTRTKSGRSK
jgi:hypothetical protein